MSFGQNVDCLMTRIQQTVHSNNQGGLSPGDSGYHYLLWTQFTSHDWRRSMSFWSICFQNQKVVDGCCVSYLILLQQFLQLIKFRKLFFKSASLIWTAEWQNENPFNFSWLYALNVLGANRINKNKIYIYLVLQINIIAEASHKYFHLMHRKWYSHY